MDVQLPIVAWIAIVVSLAYPVAVAVVGWWHRRRARRHARAVAVFNAAIARYMVGGRSRTTRRRVDPRIQRRRSLRLDRDR